MPTYFACVDPWVCEVAVENEFVTVSGVDRVPDLALGRLPARTLAEATLTRPAVGGYVTEGKQGIHSEHLGFLLAEMQSLARAHPNGVW